VKLTDHTRLYFLATRVAESGEPTSSEFGPNLDFYLKPFRERKHWGGFRLDDSKNRPLPVRVGYRYLPSFDGNPDENRGVVEVTARYPLVRGALVSNRSRVDFRFVDDNYMWRYRNRLSVEKEVSIGRLRVNPYLRGEIFYDSKFGEWSRTEAIAGPPFRSTGAGSSRALRLSEQHWRESQPANPRGRTGGQHLFLISKPPLHLRRSATTQTHQIARAPCRTTAAHWSRPGAPSAPPTTSATTAAL
jgi:hypothetical protein